MSKIDVVKLSAYAETSYREYVQQGQEYVYYGKDNLYPQYLIDLYNSSPVHHALVISIATMIYGDGVQGDEAIQEWVLSNKFDDELRKTCLDLKLQGGFIWEVVWNSEGNKILSVNHSPFEQWRAGQMDEDGNITRMFHCIDWSQRNLHKITDWPIFNPLNSEDVQIIYCKPFTVGSMYYPKPDYIGAINWVEVDKQVSIFHNNNLQNGMTPGFSIHFKNGIPPKTERDEIRRDLERQLTGARNAGKFFMTFSDGADTAPDVKPFDVNNASEQFQFVSTESTDKIMIGHRVTSPALFGVKTEGQLGGSQEIADAQVIFNKNVVQPYRSIINDHLITVLRWSGIGNDVQVGASDTGEKEASVTESFTGIQVSSALEIIQRTKDGLLSVEQGRALLQTMLNFTAEAAAQAIPSQLLLRSNSPEISDEQSLAWLKYLETVGEKIGDEWELVEESEVEDPANEYQYHIGKVKLFRRFADPEMKSAIDTGLYKIRYRYSQNLSNESRLFCRNMVQNSKQGVIYRFEDIESMDGQVNTQFSPKGESSYSIWLYKGGAYCHHRWVRQVYVRKREGGKFLPNKGLDNDKRVSEAAASDAGVPFKDTSKDWNTAATRPIDLPNRGKL
jgi:hypothetical protein